MRARRLYFNGVAFSPFHMTSSPSMMSLQQSPTPLSIHMFCLLPLTHINLTFIVFFSLLVAATSLSPFHFPSL